MKVGNNKIKRNIENEGKEQKRLLLYRMGFKKVGEKCRIKL